MKRLKYSKHNDATSSGVDCANKLPADNEGGVSNITKMELSHALQSSTHYQMMESSTTTQFGKDFVVDEVVDVWF